MTANDDNTSTTAAAAAAPRPRLFLPASAHSLARSLVLSYLTEHGHTEAARQFRRDVDDANEAFYIPHDTDVDSGTREWQDHREAEGKRVFERSIPALMQVVDEWQTFRMAARLAAPKRRATASEDDAAAATARVSTTFPTDVHKKLVAVHLQNILVAQLHRLAIHDDDDDNATQPILVTTAADKTIRLTSPDDGGATLKTLRDVHSGPVLCISQHPTQPTVFLTGSMDTNVCMIDVRYDQPIDPELERDQPQLVLDKWTRHNKYVTSTAFSPDGRTWFSAAYDRQVHVYKQTSATPLKYEFVSAVLVPGPVESAVYTRDSRFIIVGCRNSYHLHIIDLQPAQPTVALFSLNASADDTYVSFTPMSLAVSPSGKYLLLATSSPSGRVIMYRLSSTSATPLSIAEVRNFYGPRVDEYSKRRLAWLADDHYFATTSDDHAVYVFATRPLPAGLLSSSTLPIEPPRTGDASEEEYYLHTTDTQVVAKLWGHEHIVRDLWWDNVDQVLVSAGFDQNVILWK
ncbi:hypothetical protein RI367_002605 [Sorochytrium milnesiophthora]